VSESERVSTTLISTVGWKSIPTPEIRPVLLRPEFMFKARTSGLNYPWPLQIVSLSRSGGPLWCINAVWQLRC
jgi:hypothetical protein